VRGHLQFLHTQQGFGKMLGIGQTQLIKYEKGVSAPILELLLKLKSYSGRSLIGLSRA